CGKEAGPYSGRGRKPVYCQEHKKNVLQSTRTRVTGSDAVLAQKATEALCQLNGFVAIGAMFMRMPMTASAIHTATDEGFREQTYNALLLDPALCKTILKGGTRSGKVALIAAYAMLAGAVMPVAALEYKALKAERDAAREAAEAEAQA